MIRGQGRPNAGSIALLGILAIFWGINWPILKIGVAEVPPWVFRSFGGVVAAFGLFAVARLSRAPLRVPSGAWGPLALCALLNMAVWNVLMLYGVALMDSGRAAILAYTMPLWASLASVMLLGERLTLRAIAALALGLIAMALLLSADANALDKGWEGPLLIITAAASWGAGTVLVKYFAFPMPVVVVTAWQQLLGAIPVVLVALIWDWRNIDAISTAGALSVAYNATITGVLCYWAYFRVVADLPVVMSTVGTLMVPVIGVFSNAWVFDMSPANADYLALLLVIVSVLLVMHGPAKR